MYITCALFLFLGLIMKIGIISTYPKYGSQNIGDALITKSTIDAIKYVYGDGVEFTAFWREDKWNNIKQKIESLDFIVFACLAIRRDMTNQTYPYIKEIFNSKIPFGVVSAGTSLGIDIVLNACSYFTKETIKCLRYIDEYSNFFSTRGYLTQLLCENLGLNQAVFSGDVAFLTIDIVQDFFRN
jgi:polysaccharide pyruvyl transferase WcaK-like protein